MADKSKKADRRKTKAPARDIKPGKEEQATGAEFEREGMGVAPKE